MIRRRREGERGSVLVELTFVVPVLMTIVLGMFEIGMLWSASQNVVQASRSGARTASQMGTFARADEEVIRAVLATFGDEADRVVRISVYEYDDAQPNGVHADCGSSAVPTSGPGCNSYLAADFAQLGSTTYFASDTGCSGSQASGPFCPTGRDDTQRNATQVGVEVEYRYTPVSGFFGVGDRTLTQRLVMRIEPGT